MEKLTKEIAINKVQEIRDCAGDHEIAHTKEDALHFWFLECFANDLYLDDEAMEVANIIKKTKEIEFARYSA